MAADKSNDQHDKKSLLWYVYPPFLLIIITALIAVNLYSSKTFRALYITQLTADLELTARIIGSQLSENTETNVSQYNHFKEAFQTVDGRRLTIISADGTVHTDSIGHAASMENHKERPEIVTALQGAIGQSERYSVTTKQNMLYVAVPIVRNNQVQFVVRLAMPLTLVNAELQTLNKQIILTACLIAILAGLLSWWLTRRVSRRLKDILEGAEHFASGHLGFRLQMPRSHELARLADAMNTMAGQLDERIRTIIAQRNQLDAVLSGMSEAVVAFDLDERILFLNSAAETICNVQQWAVQGKTITEAIRNSQFQNIVTRVISERTSLRGDILAGANRERLLEVHGSVLNDETGEVIGGLLVLNDVTELRRLENIRKDFVANVSHELRTPITSIKGFVETLLAECSPDEKNLNNQKRFLTIIQRHADRLNQIIEDLLSLSRIEQQTSNEQLPTEIIKFSEVIDRAINLCEQNANAKEISVTRTCREELRGQVAASLLEQALVNLIDNAIKYSDEKSEVRIEANETESEIILSVHDSGCGIPREHHDRLFERFYRVDKARSRKVGGTGLGLAIVKHISHALGGYPSVVSTVGKGSTFAIHLPRKSNSASTPL